MGKKNTKLILAFKIHVSRVARIAMPIKKLSQQTKDCSVLYITPSLKGHESLEVSAGKRTEGLNEHSILEK